MYTITAVCGSGVGSSLFARKAIQEAVVSLGYDTTNVKVTCVGATEGKGAARETDIFICAGKNIAERLVGTGVPTCVAKNFINDVKGIAEVLSPLLEADEALGKIKKK